MLNRKLYQNMKIALLLPRSVIYPSLSFDIMDGFKQSLKNMGLEGYHEIVSAGIGVAAKHEEIYDHCEQFLLSGTDVIIGYMNPLAAEFVHPLFESSGKTLIVLDSGYHFPKFQKLSHAWFISLQGSLCTRVIVQKAIEDGFRNFAFSCSFMMPGTVLLMCMLRLRKKKEDPLYSTTLLPCGVLTLLFNLLENFLKKKKEQQCWLPSVVIWQKTFLTEAMAWPVMGWFTERASRPMKHG